MKKAFCHDRIVIQGGAEKVFYDLICGYDHPEDQTTIFVLFSNLTQLQIGDKTYPIVTALPIRFFRCIDRFRIHHIPLLSSLIDYRNLMVIFPRLVHRISRKLATYGPQQLVVSSFAVIKNITIPGSVESSMLYMHSPCMYVHNHYQANLDKMPLVLKPLYRRISHRIRIWDQDTDHYHQIYANSQYTADLVHQIYHLQAQIQYPQIDPILAHTIMPLDIDLYPRLYKPPYMLMIGRLVRFARKCDTVIKLCNELNIHLIVMGTGPDEQYLKSIAGPTIHFIGHIHNIADKISWIGRAQGLINLTLESFGIATAECLALGIPVWGNQEGATAELVTDQSGILVDTNDSDKMKTSLIQFAHTQRNRQIIREQFMAHYMLQSSHTLSKVQ